MPGSCVAPAPAGRASPFRPGALVTERFHRDPKEDLESMEKEVKRRWIVGVMGSGTEEHVDLAEPLGEWIAMQGYHLLTGGGGGVMTSVSRGFSRVEGRKGLVLGVLPGTTDESRYYAFAGYPNPYIEVPIRTHLPLSGDKGQEVRSRSHINVLTADLIISLPGSAGTASEIRLAFKYSRPVLLFLGESGSIDGLRGDEAPRAVDLEEARNWIIHTVEKLRDR